MTLIVTEASKFGIAMAADSAVTFNYPPNLTLSSGRRVPPTVRTGVQKIVPISSINAAVAAWGFGNVGTPQNKSLQIPLDQFLFDFANRVDSHKSITSVGNELAEEINSRIEIGKVRGGFHLAGYDKYDNKTFPVIYHVHTGHDPAGPHGPLKLHQDFPYASGRTIDKWIEDLNNDIIFWLRNGQFRTYAYFSEYLNDLMQRLAAETGFLCPDLTKFATPLEARARFLKLQISTICEFYRLSNHLETIAMPISWITISERGIEHFERIVI